MYGSNCFYNGAHTKVSYYTKWIKWSMDHPGLSSWPCGMRIWEFSCHTGAIASADIDQFPWTVSLRVIKSMRRFCAASIINNRWLLTAASCFEENPPLTAPEIEVMADRRKFPFATTIQGELRLSLIDTIHKHPEWDRRTGLNDIASVRLKEPIPERYLRRSYMRWYSNRLNVWPVCLPMAENRELKAGDKIEISGRFSQPSYAQVVVINDLIGAVGRVSLKSANCSAHETICVPDNMCKFLAGSPIVSRDVTDRFQDDTTGGYYRPLFQVGIMTKDCKTSSRATRVSHYLDWISSIMSSS